MGRNTARACGGGKRLKGEEHGAFPRQSFELKLQAKKCDKQMAEDTGKTSRTQLEQQPGHRQRESDKDDWNTKKYTQKRSAQVIIGDEQHLWEGLQKTETTDPEEQNQDKEEGRGPKKENISESKTCEECWTT